ncbi:MAG: LamG-like jellyroll fold domain-containing protein, partial [Verrucomicrobiota bacterium]
LTIEVHIVRFEHGQAYKFFTPLYTNSTPPAAPLGAYFIYSPFYSTLQSTNGSWREIEVSTNGAASVDGTENPYPDFNSVMQQMTNGIWTMVFTNTTTTNTYTFTVSAPNMTSNMLPATVISYPSDGALNIPNQPTFTWQGPGSWSVNNNTYVYNYDFSFFQYASLPSAQNNWTIPVTIPNGINCTFYLDYVTNSAPLIFTTSTPLDSHSQPLQGWITTNVIETGDTVSFAVTNPPVATPTLVAHYTFDNTGNLGQDSSGNGYDLDFNGGDGVTSTNDAKMGSGAAYFDGNSFFSYNSTPTNVLNTLAGDFSLTFWIKTTQNDGNEGGAAWAGDGIVAADVPGTAYDLVPAALDGGEIGFNTGGIYGDDTVNTTTDINDGNYHHVVITREEATGEKQIYIDGQLNNTDLATMNPLSDPRMVAIGCAIDASQTDPNSIYANPRQFFQGQLDDLQIYAGVLSSNQVVQLYTGAQTGTTLVAHYTFDNSGNLGQDSSGNGNDMSGETYWGPQHQFDADAEAGGGAVQFFGTDAMTPANSQVLTNLNAVLAGSFSFSAWVKTTITNGADYNNAFFGADIFWAYNDHGNTNDTIPLAITGSKAAFTTRGGDPGLSDNLHSITSVNDGNYHLITVTRDQSTGEKIIYVDGNFENSQIGTTNPLNGNNYNLTIGGWDYYIDSTGTNFSSYTGLLDDLQIYSGVLSGSDVAYLYNNPGSIVRNTAGQDFNPALNTTALPWATSGDANWFVESTNTYDGVSAAQSGSVTNTQTSTLSVTVTGPGTITFYWSSIANDLNGGFDYEFYYDDPNAYDEGDLYGDEPWQSIQQITGQPVKIPAGQHILYWTVFAYGDTDPTEAGFLDQVSYVPDTAPTITLNPFSRTNYPGYSAWLSANATSNPAATWQWYEVGTGAISGATSSYFIPTNSGTAGVAGSYYAIASNDVG